MTLSEIAQRLSAVEGELARLKAKRPKAKRAHPVHTLDSIHGIFENDAAFQEAMRLGRKWRDTRDVKINGKLKAKPR